ncbi:MAG: beta-galactosidase [Acidimicrobiales bacterium]
MGRRNGNQTGRAGLAGSATIAGAALGIATELQIKRRERPLTDSWRTVPVESARSTMLGITFRPLQAEAFDLEPVSALRTLLAHPFDVIRLGAYWNRIEPGPGRFDPAELDWQVDAAEAAGKQIIICVGPVKCFGYPEYFVPCHVLDAPFPEHSVVSPRTHPTLVASSTDFARRIVERYRQRDAVVAWQVEHEAVDPLGMEHSWRLSASFVRSEVDAVRDADGSRPVMLNGFLPTSSAVRLAQWWRTRSQGDSLSVAQALTDMVGVDFYPRHALFSLGRWSGYLDGAGMPWQQRRWFQLAAWQCRKPQHQVIVAEGQAEPWEAVTVPPNPPGAGMYSCLPEDVINNYNRAVHYSRRAGVTCAAYLFWGAEYWLLRRAGGDPRYLDAFARVLAEHRLAHLEPNPKAR